MLDFRPSPPRSIRIDLAALVDVIFILLIFFVLFTQFQSRVLPLELPQASGGQTATAEGLLLALGADEQIELNGQPVEREYLSQALRQKMREVQDAQALSASPVSLTLASDKNLAFGFVLQVLGVIQDAGINHVRFEHQAADF